MIQLYHNDISTCAQKVRLALAEADIAWQGHHLSLRDNEHLRPEFLAINPKGQVPVIVDGALVLTESTVINEYLADSRGCVALLPFDAAGRARMRGWTRQIDDDVFAAIAVISQAIAFRRPPAPAGHDAVDQTLAAIPDEARRQLREAGSRLGMANPALPIASRRLHQLLGDMDRVLARNEWLAGDTLSLADIGLLPFVLRLDHLAMSMMFDARPNLTRWYKIMQTRASFAPAVSDWLNPDLLARWERSGVEARPQITEMLDCVR